MKIAQYMFGKYLEPGEKIEAVFHRHPFVFMPSFWRIVILGFGVPIFLFFLFPEFVLFFVLWFLISCVRLGRAFLIYYYDALLLTNVSMIDVYWHGFFDRSSARLEYPMIEGVNTEIRGFTRTVFNFGTVTVQRGGNASPISLPDAINPNKVERRIMTYQEQFVTEQSLKDADSLKNILTTLVRHHSKKGGQHHSSGDHSAQNSAQS